MPTRRNSSGSEHDNNWSSATWCRWRQSRPRWSPAIQYEIWEFSWTASWRWMLTSISSVVPASTNFEGCGLFGTACLEDPCSHSRTLSSAIGSTIATASSAALRLAGWTVCSLSSMPRRYSSSTSRNFPTSRRPFVMSFTGFQSSVALNLKSASWCATASSVLLHHTYRNSVYLSPLCRDVDTFDLLTATTF